MKPLILIMIKMENINLDDGDYELDNLCRGDKVAVITANIKYYNYLAKNLSGQYYALKGVWQRRLLDLNVEQGCFLKVKLLEADDDYYALIEILNEGEVLTHIPLPIFDEWGYDRKMIESYGSRDRDYDHKCPFCGRSDEEYEEYDEDD